MSGFPDACQCPIDGPRRAYHQICRCEGCPGDCGCGGFDPDFTERCGCGYLKEQFGYCCVLYVSRPKRNGKTAISKVVAWLMERGSDCSGSGACAPATGD